MPRCRTCGREIPGPAPVCADVSCVVVDLAAERAVSKCRGTQDRFRNAIRRALAEADAETEGKGERICESS